MERLKVLIVDDDLIHRKNISEIVENTGMGSVIRTLGNGSLALEWLKNNHVNVVLLDAVLTEDNSLEVLKSIKAQHPDIEVIIVSDGTPESIEITLQGLKIGALDFIQKLSTDVQSRDNGIKNQLLILFSQIKIKMNYYPSSTSELRNRQPQDFNKKIINLQLNEEKVNRFDPQRWKQADLVLIAASTGGPAALEIVCRTFPADFDQPVLIVQHIPQEFTQALVESLGKKCFIPVVAGKDNDFVRRHNIIVAPGGFHMAVERNRSDEKIIRLLTTPHVNGVRPAADVLFESVAKAYEGKNILAVILTGMGNDGMSGIAEIKKKCNCYCIIQSEKTCVVYGMPRSVYEAGLADEIVDLEQITSHICKVVAGRS